MSNDPNSRIESLERLSKLLDQGHLTREEFDAEKARILGKPVVSAPLPPTPAQPLASPKTPDTVAVSAEPAPIPQQVVDVKPAEFEPVLDTKASEPVAIPQPVVESKSPEPAPTATAPPAQSAVPAAPPPVYQSPPPPAAARLAAQMPKGPNWWPAIIVAIVVVLLLVLYAIYLGQKPALVVDGKPVTDKQAHQALDEVYDMVKNAKFDDPSSIDLSKEATSPLSAKLKVHLERIVAINKAYDDKMEKFDVLQTFDYSRMGTSAGRNKSRKEFADYKATYEAYYRDLVGVQKEFEAWGNTVLTTRKIDFSENYADLKKMYDANMKAVKLGEGVLALAARHRPTYDKKSGVLYFRTGLKSFQKLSIEFGDALEKAAEIEENIRAKSAARMEENLKGLAPQS